MNKDLFSLHQLGPAFTVLSGLALVLVTAFLVGCNTITPSSGGDDFAKGADISWLPQMEAGGYVFYNEKNQAEDCLRILKDHGINAIRLRTFVDPSSDPSNGHCGKDETVAMAVRAKRYGMKVMIDFHYSDSWADPAKQRKPQAWVGHDFPALLSEKNAFLKITSLPVGNCLIYLAEIG